MFTRRAFRHASINTSRVRPTAFSRLPPLAFAKYSTMAPAETQGYKVRVLSLRRARSCSCRAVQPHDDSCEGPQGVPQVLLRRECPTVLSKRSSSHCSLLQILGMDLIQGEPLRPTRRASADRAPHALQSNP